MNQPQSDADEIKKCPISYNCHPFNSSDYEICPDYEICLKIANDGCPYDPTELTGLPIGMLHCPICGEMIVAGMPHPDYVPEFNSEV